MTPNYCRMHKFGPTICACGPRIIAGMHISQICINKAPFGNNMVRSLLRALLKSLQKSLQTNDMNIGGPRGPCSYRSYLHRYRIFDHAIGRSVQLLAGNNTQLIGCQLSSVEQSSNRDPSTATIETDDGSAERSFISKTPLMIFVHSENRIVPIEPPPHSGS